MTEQNNDCTLHREQSEAGKIWSSHLEENEKLKNEIEVYKRALENILKKHCPRQIFKNQYERAFLEEARKELASGK